jgi:hypothetical protein
VYVIKLSRMPCIGYVYVTQCKDHEEEFIMCTPRGLEVVNSTTLVGVDISS